MRNEPVVARHVAQLLTQLRQWFLYWHAFQILRSACKPIRNPRYTIARDVIKLTYLFSFLHILTCNSTYSIHLIFHYYDFIKDFWLKNVMFISSPTSFKMTPRAKILARKKCDVSPRIYYSLWRGVRDVILQPKYVVRWYFSNIQKHCRGHRVALVPIPTWYKWFQQIAILIQHNSCVHPSRIVSRILGIRILQDKALFCAFEASDIVCWLVNLPIAKLNLFKSADFCWISNLPRVLK